MKKKGTLITAFIKRVHTDAEVEDIPTKKALNVTEVDEDEDVDNSLDHQYADRRALHHERRGEERFESILTRLGEIAKVGILARPFDCDRLAEMCSLADEPLTDGQPYCADGSDVQPDRGVQRQVFAVRVA